MLPDRHLKVWSALRWFDGQAPFPRSSEDRHAASDTFAAWRQNSAPIDLFARHADQLERVAAQEDDQEAVAALKETRLTMHRLGLAPPELPEGLPELNGVES